MAVSNQFLGIFGNIQRVSSVGAPKSYPKRLNLVGYTGASRNFDTHTHTNTHTHTHTDTHTHTHTHSFLNPNCLVILGGFPVFNHYSTLCECFRSAFCFSKKFEKIEASAELRNPETSRIDSPKYSTIKTILINN